MSESENSPREQKRAYWRNHIETWRQSDISQRKYCEQAKISFHSFSWWLGRGLKSEPKRAKAKTMTFVPVTIKEPSQVKTTQLDMALIFPNQTRLVLPQTMPTQDLLNIVKALGGLA